MNIDSYPKIYRPNSVILCCLGLLLILPGFTVFSRYITDPSIYLILAGLAGVGIFLILGAFKYKTLLYRDRITQTGVFSSKELRRDDIRAYRQRTFKGAPFLDLLPADSRLKTITVTRTALNDPAFTAWLRGLEDLDAAETKAVDLALAQDDHLSGTLEDRKAQVKELLKAPNYFAYGYGAALALVVFYPHPAWLQVAVPMMGPWMAIALMATRRRDYTILGTGAILFRKGSLVPLFMLSVFFIYLVFKLEADGGPRLPLDWQRLITPSLIGATLITAIAWVVSRGEKINHFTLLKIFFPMLVYSGGSLALINSVLDHNKASIFTLTVKGKHQTSGKGAANYLDVFSNDHGYDGDTTIRTSAGVYRAATIDDTICAAIHPGALGMRWESVTTCPIGQELPVALSAPIEAAPPQRGETPHRAKSRLPRPAHLPVQLDAATDDV